MSSGLSISGIAGLDSAIAGNGTARKKLVYKKLAKAVKRVRIWIHLQGAKPEGCKMCRSYNIRRRFLVEKVSFADARISVWPFFFSSLALPFEKGFFCWQRWRELFKVLLHSVGRVKYIKAALSLCIALGVCGSRGRGGFSSL